jgi:hypothetical protein
VPTRPDRLIDRAGFEVICEIKEFTTDAMKAAMARLYRRPTTRLTGKPLRRTTPGLGR